MLGNELLLVNVNFSGALPASYKNTFMDNGQWIMDKKILPVLILLCLLLERESEILLKESPLSKQ